VRTPSEAIRRDVVTDPTPGLALIYSRLHHHLPSAVPLVGKVVTLGRDGDNTLALPESSVSRHHARFERRDDGQVWLVDDASLNGTFVNGRRVRERALAAHDLVRVGDTVFRFIDKGVHGYAAYRIDGSVVTLARPFAHDVERPELIGGYQLDALLDRMAQVAAGTGGVVVRGESGTGKHLLARALHRASGRSGPLLGLNCATLPEAQVDAELFGSHAETTREENKPGLLAAAQGGTVFLDEVGDLPLPVQDKLLHVLCAQTLPAGDERQRAHAGHPVDVRLVCATHHDLRVQVTEGTFREALLERLRSLELVLPPLRERREDLYALLQHFLALYGHPQQAVSFPFLFALLHYHWPYNVSELESAIRVAVKLADGAVLDLPHLPEGVRAALALSGEATSSPLAACGGPANMMVETAPAASLHATDISACLLPRWPRS
jgi:transcriptional regulator of acetoin/glycerol metabolism